MLLFQDMQFFTNVKRIFLWPLTFVIPLVKSEIKTLTARLSWISSKLLLFLAHNIYPLCDFLYQLVFGIFKLKHQLISNEVNENPIILKLLSTNQNVVIHFLIVVYLITQYKMIVIYLGCIYNCISIWSLQSYLIIIERRLSSKVNFSSV